MVRSSGRRPALVAALALFAGGGCVSQGRFDAQLAETQRYQKELADQTHRKEDLEAKVADLTARLGRTEQERTQASAEMERQRSLVGELTTARDRLESERASAAAEAERQRRLAAQLEGERSALQKKSAEYQALTASLSDEIKAGRIQISELRGKMTVRLAERVLFRSGSAAINREGKEALEKIAAAFQDLRGRIVRVEGHTDDVPIHTEAFPSNWELSAARAIAVVRFLQAQGVDPHSLGAAGYAEFQPIADNDTPEGRAQNRRIEITLATPPPAVPEAK